jgi:hypothetical protein
MRLAKYEAHMNVWWLFWELCLSGLMMGCLATWFVYSTQLVEDDVFKTRYVSGHWWKPVN